MKKGLFVNEAASIASVSNRTVSNWCRQGKLDASKDARGRYVINKAKLANVMKTRSKNIA
jgi:predicted site-specific integrase-resolvase